MKKFLLLALSLTLAGFVNAQNPQTPTPSTDTSQDEVVRITTNLVQIDAVVTRDGKPVRNLKVADFEIFEDGHKQTITSFSYVNNVVNSTSQPSAASTSNTPVPLTTTPSRPFEARRTIALVVDDLGTSAESMSSIRKQLRKFVTEHLQPNDLVAIIRTGGDVGALQQFTADRNALFNSIDQLRWNFCSRVGPTVFRPNQPPIHSVSPSSGQSIIQSEENMTGGCGLRSVSSTLKSLSFILRAMGELPGRKSMVLFSDSIPRQEQEEELFVREDPQLGSISTESALDRNVDLGLRKLAEIAIRNSVVIYGVDTQGLQYTGPTAADQFGGSARNVSQQVAALSASRSNLLWQRRAGAELLANETGGFLVRNSNSFRLPEILEDQEGYYLIGYTPTEETFNKKFHHIKVEAKGSGLKTRTRKGFYGISEEDVESTKSKPKDPFLMALVSPFSAHDINVDLVTLFSHVPNGPENLRCYLNVPGKDLSFEPLPDGSFKTAFEVRGVLFGNNGALVDSVNQGATLTLKPSAYQQVVREGLALHFDMPVKRPGAYQFRAAIKDVATSKLGSAGQFVVVPNISNKLLAMSGVLVVSATSQGVESPARRRFKAGSNLMFLSTIYNASLDPATGKPRITIQPKLFHEGKVVNSSSALPLDVATQTDLSNLQARGIIHLDAGLEPGKYFLQLIVVDSVAKEKQNETVQWIDFEIVGP